MTVKLRSGLRAGETQRLRAGPPARRRGRAWRRSRFHPRSAAAQHKGVPDYELAARLVATLPAPVILTGGLNDAERVHEAFEQTGAAAVMIARGALGNPWLFAQLLGARQGEPRAREVLAELAGRSSAP